MLLQHQEASAEKPAARPAGYDQVEMTKRYHEALGQLDLPAKGANAVN